MEDPAFGDFRQPDIYKPAEQFRVFARCDVNTVARCESRTNNFRIGAEVDDQIGGREQFARVFVESAAQIKLGFVEPAARMEESREAVKIEVESAIHQNRLSALA